MTTQAPLDLKQVGTFYFISGGGSKSNQEYMELEAFLIGFTIEQVSEFLIKMQVEFEPMEEGYFLVNAEFDPTSPALEQYGIFVPDTIALQTAKQAIAADWAKTGTTVHFTPMKNPESADLPPQIVAPPVEPGETAFRAAFEPYDEAELMARMDEMSPEEAFAAWEAMLAQDEPATTGKEFVVSVSEDPEPSQ